MTHLQAALLIASWSRFPVHEINLAIVAALLSTDERHQISFWHAAVIELARAAGCDFILSENLRRGQDYGGVLAMNPFVDAADQR